MTDADRREALAVRPLTRLDFSLLHTWLSAPHVDAWWRESHDAATLEAHYGPRIDGREPTHVLVMELDTQPIGFVQWYRWRDYPEHAARLGAGATAAGLDLAIGDPAHLGRGLGPRTIELVVDTIVFADPSIAACIVDPEQRNVRSTHAFTKAGFTKLRTILDGDTPREVMQLTRMRSGATSPSALA